MKNLMVLILTFLFCFSIVAQNPKTNLVEEDIQFIQTCFNNIIKSDQICRLKMSAKTLDPVKIAKLDSLNEHADMEEVIQYRASLQNELTKEQKDSLINLQRQIDFTNHMVIRGIWDRYGWISEEVIKENNFVQQLLLLHPPHDVSQIPEYLENYKAKLILEVEAGRMPAQFYAQFVDNILGKILGKPQLYGTNGIYDVETNSIKAPKIANIDDTNSARVALGLSALRKGEYTLIEQ